MQTPADSIEKNNFSVTCHATQLGLGERLCPPCSSSLSLYSAAGEAERDRDADRAGVAERDRERDRDRSRSFSLLMSR